MTTDSYDLRVCVLASGSSGNCIYVESPTTAILLDAGLSARQTLLRLNKAGLNPDELRAICISHEHSDHSTGVARLHKKYGWELYANSDTARAVDRACCPGTCSAPAPHLPSAILTSCPFLCRTTPTTRWALCSGAATRASVSPPI